MSTSTQGLFHGTTISQFRDKRSVADVMTPTCITAGLPHCDWIISSALAIVNVSVTLDTVPYKTTPVRKRLDYSKWSDMEKEAGRTHITAYTLYTTNRKSVRVFGCIPCRLKVITGCVSALLRLFYDDPCFVLLNILAVEALKTTVNVVNIGHVNHQWPAVCLKSEFCKVENRIRETEMRVYTVWKIRYAIFCFKYLKYFMHTNLIRPTCILHHHVCLSVFLTIWGSLILYPKSQNILWKHFEWCSFKVWHFLCLQY